MASLGLFPYSHSLQQPQSPGELEMNKGEERKVKNRNVGDKSIKRVNTEDETGIYCISHSDSLNRDLKNLCVENLC